MARILNAKYVNDSKEMQGATLVGFPFTKLYV